MTHSLPTLYLAVVAVFFLASGAVALAQPRRFAQSLDLALARAGGGNEIRAQYGGFFLALGAACGLASMGILAPRFGLGAAALTFGGVTAGRFLGLAADRGMAGYGSVVRVLFLVDALGCALAAALILGT